MTIEQETLIVENMNLAHYVAHQMKSVPIEFEDRRSLAYIGLVKAAGRFDPEKGIKFASYAVPAMRNEILMGQRSEKRYRGLAYLDAPAGTETEGIYLADLLPDKRQEMQAAETRLDFKAVMKRVVPRLKCREAEVFRMIIENPGGTQGEYAKILGISQSVISRHIKSIRLQFEEELQG